MVVIPTLLFSLIESLLVLPCHLSHRVKVADEGVSKNNRWSLLRLWHRLQTAFAARMDSFIHRYYAPFLGKGRNTDE